MEPLRPKEIVLSPNSEILAVVSQQKDVFTLYLEAMELLEQEEAQQHMTFVKTGLHNFRITAMDMCQDQVRRFAFLLLFLRSPRRRRQASNRVQSSNPHSIPHSCLCSPLL